MTNHDDGPRRILVIDDQQAIHDDFDKVLSGSDEVGGGLQDMRAAFFGAAETKASAASFDLVHALQGEEGIDLHARASAEERPFSVAFVDVRMPPGLDGVQTIKRLWEADADLQTVICTAYSDYSFDDIVGELGQSDRLLILKKPFDPMEVRQLAEALSAKWASLRAQRDQLERLQRANEELRVAESAAQAASRAKSQFLTNMSHEIRTPLNAMLGYVDFVCDDGTTSDDRAKYEQTIRRSGEHLMRILDDVLDLARVEENRARVEFERVDPVAIAREVGRMHLPEASSKDLTLRMSVESPVPAELETDGGRVRQVLAQLVGNAIKYTPEGSIDLILRATADELRWRIVDTGPGIPADEQAQVFEMFHQRDNSLTRASGGLGIGLALARRIAEQLGGRLDLESEEGVGCAFTLAIPTGGAPLVDVPAEACELDPATAAAKPRRELGELAARVLVVEDVKLNRVLLAKVLRKAGAEVALAEDGQQGVDAVHAANAAGEPFDLVLMDMQMPVLDGYSATRLLRDEGDRTPIVALTAHAMKGDRERCLEAGCDDYATKPIDRVALVELCRTLVAGAPDDRRAA